MVEVVQVGSVSRLSKLEGQGVGELLMAPGHPLMRVGASFDFGPWTDPQHRHVGREEARRAACSSGSIGRFLGRRSSDRPATPFVSSRCP